MRGSDGMRTGGEILADQLVIHGVRHVFCVPGESYIAALDGMYGGPIELTVCRQEGGASMMAEAVGKATGRPGICFVTRGPGATNASAGLHIARQDSTPMILFVGQIGRDMRDREAFQELDYRAVFGSIAKWVTEIDDPARIPELVSRAFYTATNGRPGPVVVALPEDMLEERAAVADVPAFETIETSPGAAEIERMRQLLADAAAADRHRRRQPLVGGRERGADAVRGALRHSGRDLVPPHPCDGSAASELCRRPRQRSQSEAARAREGGGPRAADRRPARRMADAGLHAARRAGAEADADPRASGHRGARPRLPAASRDPRHADRVRRRARSGAAPNDVRWRDETKAAHADYLAFSEKPTAVPGPVNLGEIVVGLRDALPADAIVTTGAGNFSIWVQRFYRYRKYGTLYAPASGSMGYGLPSAVAMKRTMPDRTVVAFCGDGDFMMTGQEFATAVQYELPLIAVVVDNGIYGTIRMHQERHHPGRVIATTLRNPDFAAYAKAFGGVGFTVEKTADFAPAFKAAQQAGKPAIIHVKVDPDAIAPSATLSAIRKQAQAAAER